MRRPSRTGLSWMLVLCAILPSIAQNLEAIGTEKPLSLSGGISVNQIGYTSRGIRARRDPYTYFASANVGIGVYGWIIPLTFTVSSRQTSFSQPFNQYAMHPTWKWITLHAGYTSMTLSPYTVNGHTFSGGGVELTPGKWKFNALYGRFLKAVEADSALNPSRQTAFQRNGYAMKVSYGDEVNYLDLILFHAHDDATSIRTPPDSLGITPQENLVISIGGGRSVLKHFVFKGEFASSAITKDTRAADAASRHLLGRLSPIFQPRLSSSYYKALKSSFDYRNRGWTIGLGYERIDPGYRTLGAYYFNNDLENITLHTSADFYNGKINMTLTGGVQHDNLENTKISTMRRMVSAVNINCAPSPRLSMSGAWSTFQTYTNIRSQFETVTQLTPYDQLDTLNFTQISANASVSGMYSLGTSKNTNQHVNVNFSWQRAAETQGNSQEHSPARFFTANAGYTLAFVPANTSVSVTFNASVNDSQEINMRMMGPALAINRSFMNRKLRTTISSSWNKTHTNGESANTVVNARLSSVWSIRNKHNVNLSIVMVNRTTPGGESPAVTELTATAGYSYSFGRRK